MNLTVVDLGDEQALRPRRPESVRLIHVERMPHLGGIELDGRLYGSIEGDFSVRQGPAGHDQVGIELWLDAVDEFVCVRTGLPEPLFQVSAATRAKLIRAGWSPPT